MSDLSSVIADFLQLNKPESNISNPSVINQVTTQPIDIKAGNLSNPGNLKILSIKTLTQILTNAAQASGLTADVPAEGHFVDQH